MVRDGSEIAERICSDLEKDVTKARRRCLFMGTMLIVMVGYLGWVYSSVAPFDAAETTRMARVHIESELPNFEERASEAVLEAVPELMDRGEAAVLEAPSTLSVELRKGLDDGMDRLVDTMERGLNEELSAEVDQLLAQFEGEQLETARVEELLDRLRQIHRERCDVLLDVLYVDYANEVTRVDDYLVRLQKADDLSDRELAHKEIIEATVALRDHMDDLVRPWTR